MKLSDNMQNWFNFDPCYVIVSKWVPNLILQAYYKLLKTCFLYTFCRPYEKSVQISCFTSTSTFYNTLTAFPFEKFLTDNFRTYGLRDRDNLLENVILDILKKVMPKVPVFVTTNAVPYF